MEHGLKILSAKVKNFKNIEQKIVDIGGQSMVFVGPNRAGKSSLIQAIMSPLDSKFVPSKAIKEGEERGSVEVVIGGAINGVETTYRLEMYFSQQHQKGRIKIFDKEDNAVPSSKTLINSIVGNIGFDIFRFLNLALTPEGKPSKAGVKQQIEILKSFMSPEDKKKLVDLNNEYQRVYEDRTYKNKRLATIKAEYAGAEFSQEDINKYEEPIDPSPIIEKINNMSSAIDDYQRISSGVEMEKKNIDTYQQEIESLEERIAMLKGKIQESKEKVDKGEKWLKKNEKPDTKSLTETLELINKHNAMHEKVKKYMDMHGEIRSMEADINAISSTLKDLDKKKKELFAESTLPVKGLEFDDDQILYKGLPFNEDHQPKSVLITVGAAIAMAMNPNLKVVVVKDGSLLDEETMETLLRLVEKKGYQLLIEVVDFRGKDFEVVFAEEFLNQE